jgi:CxxH/CxxC protein (TIGR04129 family)
MYACKEHIDYVMEDFIDQYQVDTSMEPVTWHDAWCDGEAQYELRLEEEDTTLAPLSWWLRWLVNRSNATSHSSPIFLADDLPTPANESHLTGTNLSWV